MFDYLIYMLIPTLISAFLIYILGIRRFRLESKVLKMAPFILGVTCVMFFAGDAGTCVLKPWVFDCAKTIGFCPCGLPIEDFLFSFLVVLNISMATLTFSEIEKRSVNRKEFFEIFFFLRK